MWFIVENTEIKKVSIDQENDEQIEIISCPDDILSDPAKYKLVGGVFEEIIN